MVKLENVTGASFSVFYYMFWLAGLIYTGYNIRNNVRSFLRYSSTISQKESRELDIDKVQFPKVLICSGQIDYNIMDHNYNLCGEFKI